MYIARNEDEIIEASKLAEKKETAISLIRDELDDTILRNINEKSRVELYQKLANYPAECGVKEKQSWRGMPSISFSVPQFFLL